MYFNSGMAEATPLLLTGVTGQPPQMFLNVFNIFFINFILIYFLIINNILIIIFSGQIWTVE